MRLSERTHYNLNRLHAIFAVSALALLGVTVWMLAVDHWRPWKAYQRTYREQVEPWLIESRIRQTQSREYLDREAELLDALAQAQTVVSVELSENVAQSELDRQNAARSLRFARADFDQARSAYEAAVGRGGSDNDLKDLVERTARWREEVERRQTRFEQVSLRHERLLAQLADVRQAEDEAQLALDEHRATLTRLGATLAEQRPSMSKDAAGLPLVDALGRPLAVDQIWLPELTIDYNFRQVARFDRCMTCHQGIDKATLGPGWLPEAELASAGDPARTTETHLTVQLATPQAPDDEPEAAQTDPLIEAYGFSLAASGILDANAPTVGIVDPDSPASLAGLFAGDVIEQIGEELVSRQTQVVDLLLDTENWGKPLTLKIRRGLPHPYSSHPRLDLFVGSLSPHPASRFGCTICHDGQGSATDFTFASHSPNDTTQHAQWHDEYGWSHNEHWDFPMLPARFAESRCLKCHHDVVDLEPSSRFPEAPAPKLVTGYQTVRQYGCYGCHEINGLDTAGRSIGPDMRLAPTRNALPSGPNPATMPKVGPSLRHLAEKLDAPFVNAWSANPTDFRPDTRMPRFLGLHDHLDGPSLADGQRFEAVEIHAISAYLLGSSTPTVPPETPEQVTEEPSSTRGEELFVMHGCVACHRHDEVDDTQSSVGPDLSRLGSKLTTPQGRQWLVRWIRDPFHYRPRTPMPNTLLAPIPLPEQETSDEPGAPTPRKMTDPAADIGSFLLDSDDWAPQPVAALVEADLDALALLHLRKTYPQELAEQYLRDGIPESAADGLSEDLAELLAPITLEKKARYVGRHTIAKRGCYACHGITGFDNRQPIGPALSDWGRKQESLLAFEQVGRFLEEREAEQEADADRSFYLDAVRAGRREGFLWQKLRQPRSFDFKKTENKGYNERLVMGQLNLTPQQREAVSTFVLGLVAQPPGDSYVHAPKAPVKAIVEGRKVLDKYACAECHTLEMDRWSFYFDPDEFEEPFAAETFDFVLPQFTDDELAASEAPDRSGRGLARVTGRPFVDPYGEMVEDFDYDDNPMYIFELWSSTAINGVSWRTGGQQVPVVIQDIVRRRPAQGGAFARLLYPLVAEEAGSLALESWGWVPPPLTDEGAQVRPDWLYEYMLDPAPIRPAVKLRMPRFQLSAAEAGALADYFAAASGVEFPYSSNRATPVDAFDPSSERMTQALSILLDRKTYCAKCHVIGDYNPGGETQTIVGPDLAVVGRRMRPEYLRRWLADPKSVLPYTGMPVNFPPSGDPLGQDIFPGTSLQQLDAVVELLLNFDRVMHHKASIRTMVDQ